MSTMSSSSLGAAQERLVAIQHEARDFLKREWPERAYRALIEDPTGYSPGLWTKMTGLGWPGILIAEEYGGVGMSFLEFYGVAAEIGRTLATSPLCSTVVAAQAVALSSNEALKREVLPRVASGAAAVALAVAEDKITIEPRNVSLTAIADGDGYRLDGMKLFVPFASAANEVVTLARLDGALALFVVDARAEGLTQRQLVPLDWSPLSELVYEGVRVPAGRLIAKGDEATAIVDEVLLQSTMATCTELLGVAEGALEMAVEYAGSRVAFGRPIGSFQAVKHKLVNLRTSIEVARVLLQGASQEVAARATDRAISVARAAFWCVDTLRKVPEGAVQAHGGIGFTWEHDVHCFLRRGATLTALLGEPAMYREIVADHIEHAAD